MQRQKLEVIKREPASKPHPTPLLFVHGAWHGAWCWDEHFLAYFAEQGYASWALSLRAHGASSGRVRWASYADYVADMRQVVAQMPAPPIIIGHSLGGYVVQKYLEQYEAPAAVLMASVPVRGITRLLFNFTLRHPIAILKTFATLNPYHFVGSVDLTRQLLFSETMPEAQVQRYFRLLVPESFRIMLDSLFLNLPRPQQTNVKSWLVLAAAEDKIFGIHEAEQTAQAYHTTAEIFPNIAHDMMLEQDWEKVARRILGWLQTQGI